MPGDYHLVVQVWTLTPRGEIVVTQRHPDKPFPLYWECTGGAALLGETSEEAAVREVREEIGLDMKKPHYRFLESYQSQDTFYDAYLQIVDVSRADLRLQPTEVVDAKLIRIEEFRRMLDKGELIPSSARFLPYAEDESLHFN
jgi:8-oxo-dGTP pyrophosphatase MutT (NUDIX family)